MTKTFDIIIIGAGAAGLVAAQAISNSSRSVLVLDHNSVPGRKFLVSGGGRSNFSNISIKPSNFMSSNMDFCRSALSRFQTEHFLDYCTSKKIPWVVEKNGQIFCRNSARELVSSLVSDCRKTGVIFGLSQKVTSVFSKNNSYTVRTSEDSYQSDSLIVATGGLSYKNLGASGIGYEIARRFGHTIITPRPALVPLIIEPKEWIGFSSCSGSSFQGTLRAGRIEQSGDILLTHTGLSGPAVLQFSLFLDPLRPFEVDLIGSSHKLDFESTEEFVDPQEFLSRAISKKFSKVWKETFHWNRPVTKSNRRLYKQQVAELQHWGLTPVQTQGFTRAEVTAGGIDTRFISSKTMESTLLPNLFFLGEVLDVTGMLGGYNIHWAWASANACATHFL